MVTHDEYASVGDLVGKVEIAFAEGFFSDVWFIDKFIVYINISLPVYVDHRVEVFPALSAHFYACTVNKVFRTGLKCKLNIRQ